MKTVDADGQVGSVVINEPAYDRETGEAYTKHDLSKASFDVDVGVGPSSTSLRATVVRALTGIASITDDPQTKQALTLATIANLEGEGLRDLRDWARARAIRMGLIKPNEDERAKLAEEQANAQPDPQTEYLRSAAAEAEANAAQARAKTVDTIAAAGLKRAQTAKTIADTEGSRLGQAIDAADAMVRAATPPDGAAPL